MDEDKNTYIVEMQCSDQRGFEKRAQYYAAKAYINQMNRGDKKYENLKEVIFLAITNFKMFPEKKAYKSDHVILDNQTYEHDLQGFTFTFLELTKFDKQKHELNTMVEKWSYYFKYAEETKESEVNEIFKDDMVIKEAYEELNRFNWTEEELLSYDQEIKRKMDNQAVADAQKEKLDKLRKDIDKSRKSLDKRRKSLNESRKRLNESRKSLDKRRNEFISEGEAIGIEKGIEKTAKKMLLKGYSNQEVVDMTGLTTQKVEFIKKSLENSEN